MDTQLWKYAEPLPSPEEVVTGIPHKNPCAPEPLQEPVQALASRKTHYLKQMTPQPLARRSCRS